MGFLDKLRRKKGETVEKVKEQTTPQPTHRTSGEPLPAEGSKSILLKENQSMNKSQFYHGCSFLTAGRGERYISSKQV
jgi:hypothetical protein